jgi:hypothetical protein
MMQATTQSQPEAIPAPAAAPATAVQPRPSAITTVGADGKPITLSAPVSQAEVEALVRQRSELSDQLIGVTNRRAELVQQVRSAPDGVSRTGLEDRMKILDQRILQLESDLATTGRQLALAPADLVAIANRASGGPPGGGDDFEEGMLIGGFMAVLFVAVVAAFRRFRRRKQKPARKTELAGDSTQRLERLEQGMEAIAIEIERVSEGQRFVTKLLSEAAPVGLGTRIAQPVPLENEKAANP